MIHTEATFVALPAVMRTRKLHLVAAAVEEKLDRFDRWVPMLLVVIEVVEMEVTGDERMHCGRSLGISEYLLYFGDLIDREVSWIRLNGETNKDCPCVHDQERPYSNKNLVSWLCLEPKY